MNLICYYGEQQGERSKWKSALSDSRRKTNGWRDAEEEEATKRSERHKGQRSISERAASAAEMGIQAKAAATNSEKQFGAIEKCLRGSYSRFYAH